MFRLKKLVCVASVTLSAALLMSTMAFASSNSTEDSKFNVVKPATILASSSSDDLSDSTTISETVNYRKTYDVRFQDEGERFFQIGSGDKAIRVTLTKTSGYGENKSTETCFDSGYFRKGYVIFGKHLETDSKYELTVICQQTGTSLTTSMTKSGNGNQSWVNFSGLNNIYESGSIPYQQSEEYDFAFQAPGRYKITLTSGFSGLQAIISNRTPGAPNNLAGGTYTYHFDVAAATGEVQTYYTIRLTNINPNVKQVYSIYVTPDN